jgi:DNA-binding transcriptional ArsR family regulator
MDDSSAQPSLLAALRHPLRRRILQAMLGGEPTSPRDLATTLEQPLGDVSYHVGVLSQCGAIVLVETKPAHGSMQHFYRAEVEAEWAHEVLGLDADRHSNGGPSPQG